MIETVNQGMTYKWREEGERKAYLHGGRDGLPFGEDLGEAFGAKNVAEGGGCKQTRRPIRILHVGDSDDGVVDAVIHYGIYRHCH